MLIIIKAASGCNMGCRYCSGDHTRDGDFMSVEVCDALMAQLPVLLMPQEEVVLLWQGGEPTLLPPQMFAALCACATAALKLNGHRVRHQIQSNGLHISAQWRELMRRNDMEPGISLDGPAFLHDAMRRTAGDTPSYAQVLATVASLQEEGFSPSLLCVVTQDHTRHVAEIVQWMEESGLPVRFNPLLSCGRSNASLPEASYFQFLREIFTLCTRKNLDISVQPLKWMLEAVLWGKAPTECSYNNACGHSVLTLYPDGQLGTCGRAARNFGNILHTRIEEMRSSGAWKALRERGAALDAVCGGCSIRPWCNGGCPDVNGIRPEHSACEARREFFTWLRHEGLRIVKDALLCEKEELRSSLAVLKEARRDLIHV